MKSSAEPLVDVRDLAVHFPTSNGTLKAIDGVSFSVDAAETLGIVGESGSGKSMTALALLRLVPRPGKIVSGRILFNGHDLLTNTDSEMRQMRGRELTMILQDPMSSLNPSFSIGDQVGEAIRIHLGLRGSALRTSVIDILTRVGIPEAARRLHDYPHQMSGGMRQRVVGAMMLSTRPRLLIADEPTTALDVTVQAQYLELLRVLQQELQFALILISHDMGVIATTCQRVAVMYAGRIVEAGPTEQVLTRPAHPYTQALLDCLPDIDGPVQRLTTIGGQPPDPRTYGTGCRFAPRCPRAQDACSESYPEATHTIPERSWHCFFPITDG
jgi:peptide/nickel transport system ATP-binding protein